MMAPGYFSAGLKATMTDSEMKPIERPDVSHLREAVQRGLGRALFWAKKGVWTEKDILLEACLHDLRYDRQCEEARGPWLWRIMEAVGVIEDFQEKILDALRVIDDGLAAEQLCQFCVFYSRNGDERFRRRLQEIVERKPISDCPWLGEEELIDLDGETGFLLAARARSESLLHRDWDLDDVASFDMAVRKLGKQVVVTLMDREAQLSAAMSRFRDGWRAAIERKASEPRQNHSDRMRQYSLNDIIQAAEVTREPAGWFHGWGMYAQDTDLRLVLDRLFNSQDPVVLLNYLRVFSNRPMPEFDARIFGLLDHEDENVRSRAFTALAQNTHPAIRRFAVDQVQTRIDEPDFLELFIRNFRVGDEELLLKNIRIPDDVDRSHWLLMDVTKILEHNAESQCSELAKLAYRCTPCGSCRFHSAKLLVTRKVAPAWLVEECQYDAVSDTRELVAEHSAQA